MEGTCIIREGGDLLPAERVSTNLRYFASVRPTWDGVRAGELVEAFDLDSRKRVSALSRGQRSALGAVVGIASRTPLTIFDEVYLGMDAPSRQRFYDELLADTVAHPRTVVVSSHLIDEIDRLLERVLILDRGRVVIAEDADTLRGRGATLTGPAATVARAVDGLNVVGERHLGPVRQVTVFDDLGDGALAAARDAGLEIGPVPLQDLFIHLTGSR
jgi:ABC-2 type transport system ATP-binding protein